MDGSVQWLSLHVGWWWLDFASRSCNTRMRKTSSEMSIVGDQTFFDL